MRIAAFIDRDGVINHEVNLLTKKGQIQMIQGAAEGIKMLNKMSILAIIVTNQPVVARNMITEEQLQEINKKIVDNLKGEGAVIDGLYYCPHHPEKNHPEASNPRYRIVCNCRKPKTGMIEKAAKKFKIDVPHSYVIGDRTTDVQLGKNAGCTTLLVKSSLFASYKKNGIKPDYYCKDLLDACKKIAKENDNLKNTI